jgi:hypothetical protein
MASHKLLFYVSLVSHPGSPIETRLVASIAHRAERGANSREVEAETRAEAARQNKEVSSSKFLVGERGKVKFDEERNETSGEAVDTSSRIVELE